MPKVNREGTRALRALIAQSTKPDGLSQEEYDDKIDALITKHERFEARFQGLFRDAKACGISAEDLMAIMSGVITRASGLGVTHSDWGLPVQRGVMNESGLDTTSD